MNWAAFDWGRAIEALIVLATGLGLYLQQRAAGLKMSKKLDHNTKKTEDALAAASAAKSEATAINRAQADELDVYRARRVLAALETLPECEHCRASILRIADRRKVWASKPPPPELGKEPLQ